MKVMMEWPIHFKDQMIVGNPRSAVAICSLWSRKELAVKDLSPSDFAICGQLYSKEGVKYIVRNLLANPNIRFFIVCGQDKSGSGQVLLDFFQGGDLNDAIIPKAVLAELRQNIKAIDLRGEIDAAKIKETIRNFQPSSGQWAEPMVFEEEALPETAIFPTDPSGFKIRFPFVASAWPWILKYVMRFGVEKATDYGVKEKEILNLVAVITDENPENLKFVDYFNFTQQDFEAYAPQILFAGSHKQAEEISYTYGDRLRNYNGIDQIKTGIIEKLKQSINSRRALACTWQVEKDIESKQPPCLDLVQAICQNNRLYLTAYLRSNDLFGAWPQNTLALRKLQNMIAQELAVELGDLTTISCSAHIYEQDFEKASDIIKNYAQGLQCGWDGRGNFIVDLDRPKNEIIVSHYSPDGLKIGEYRGLTAMELSHLIDKDLGISQIGHALYMGQELQKAENALKFNKEYKQDHQLK